MDESMLVKGREQMKEVVALVGSDLLTVQTVRAKPALVEEVRVEAYEGTVMTVKELATITAPDSHSLIINPWDKTLIEKLVKALNQADLGVSPVVDQEMIRIVVPALSQERRQELVKLVKQKVEAGKAMLRQARSELKKEIDSHKDEPGVSEDDIHRLYDRLQSLIDEYNQKLDNLGAAKEAELMVI